MDLHHSLLPIQNLKQASINFKQDLCFIGPMDLTNALAIRQIYNAFLARQSNKNKFENSIRIGWGIGLDEQSDIFTNTNALFELKLVFDKSKFELDNSHLANDNNSNNSNVMNLPIGVSRIDS